MTGEILVHRSSLQVAGSEYDIQIFTRNDGSHVAITELGPCDIVINDAPSLAEVLVKHQQLLPLAIDSRQILREFRSCQGGMEN